jgi:hypothetical protein
MGFQVDVVGETKSVEESEFRIEKYAKLTVHWDT